MSVKFINCNVILLTLTAVISGNWHTQNIFLCRLFKCIIGDCNTLVLFHSYYTVLWSVTCSFKCFQHSKLPVSAVCVRALIMLFDLQY